MGEDDAMKGKLGISNMRQQGTKSIHLRDRRGKKRFKLKKIEFLFVSVKEVDMNAFLQQRRRNQSVCAVSALDPTLKFLL